MEEHPSKYMAKEETIVVKMLVDNLHLTIGSEDRTLKKGGEVEVPVLIGQNLISNKAAEEVKK